MTILASLTVIFGYISWLLVRKGGVWNHGTESDYSLDQNMPVNTPEKPQVPTATIPEETPVLEAPSGSSAMLWDTPKKAYHSTRVICDEMRLTFALKNELCATIMGESEFKIGIVHPNYVFDKVTGARKVSTTDYGICQWNDWWHWTKSKEISPDEALHNPEKAVRLMCTYFKQGLQNQWCAHSNGSYKKFLNQTYLQSLLA